VTVGPLRWPAVPIPPELRRRLDRLATTAVHRAWEWGRRKGLIGPDHPLARRYGAFGAGSFVAFPTGDLVNGQAVHIGRDCMVGADVTFSVGMPTEVYPSGGDPVISVGDRSSVGKGCWLVARRRIDIEADVTFAPNVYVTDHNHTYADPWLPVGIQLLAEDPVRIGAGTWLGTNVVVLPGADIGRNCTVAAGSVVRGTIPDHSVVAGVPAKVVRSWTLDGGWEPPLRIEIPFLEGWPVGVPPPDLLPAADVDVTDEPGRLPD
jgi:acetyltransferase-like isoleucine patch superfamily enzyme